MMAFRTVGLSLLATLMLGLSSCALSSVQTDPSTIELSADLVRVPADCGGLLSVDITSIRKKFDLGNKDFLTSYFATLSETLGAPLLDLARITVVFPSDQSAPFVMVLGSKPLPQEAILKALCPKNKQTQVGGKTVYSHDASALAFVTDCLLVTGPRESVSKMLDKVAPPRQQEIQSIVEQAATHDVTFYAKPQGMFAGETFTRLGLESVLANLDFGKTTDIRIRMECTSHEKAEALCSGVQGGVNLVRGQLLMMAGMKDASGLIQELAIKDFKLLPLDLMRKAEQGLGHSRFGCEGKTVTVTTSLPIEATFLRGEMEKLSAAMKEQGVDCGGFFPFPLMVHQHKTDPSVVLTTPGGPIPEPTGPVPSLPAPSTATPSVPSPDTKSTNPSILPSAHYLQHPPQYMPQSVVPVAATQATGPVAVKWTVANLRKEEASLFEMATDGKMTFRQKLPPGEAVDLTSVGTTRWVAFSHLGQQADSYEAKAEGVWLLRPVGPTAVPPSAVPSLDAPSPLPPPSRSSSN